MKKINNIGFILALILCVLMLFAYCNRASATDVSIITGDIYNGDLTPDNPDYIPPDSPSNINTNVVTPNNFGSNIATNPTENLNIFSSSMNFDSYNTNVNSDRMYYSKQMLSNKKYICKSLYSVILKDLNINPFTPVKVKLSSIDYTVETTGVFYFHLPGNYPILSDSHNFYKAYTYQCTTLNFTPSDYYLYAYLLVDVPYYGFATDFINNLYEPAFYISEIIFDGFSSNVVNDVYISHLFDVCYPQDSFVVPKNNTVFLSCVNNLGSYFNKFDLPTSDYLLLSQITTDDEVVRTLAEYNDYSFLSTVGNVFYSSFQSDSNTINVDFLAFFNKNFYDDFLLEESAGTGIQNVYDFLLSLKNTTFNENMPIFNKESYKLNYFSIGYQDDLISYNSGFCPSYPFFSFFSLMPAGSTDGYGNLSFDDINSSKYYIEPQDWKDFGAYFNNIVVWLCFEMPLLSNLTKPIYMFLNGFLEIWVQIALPLATAFGLIGGALIFYLIYLFISKLLFNKTPD